MGNREQWPQKYVNDKVYDLVNVVSSLVSKVASLQAQIDALDAKKADRRGRKPTDGRTSG